MIAKGTPNKAPPLRARAFSVPFNFDELDREVERLVNACDLDALVALEAKVQPQLAHGREASLLSDAEFWTSLKTALDSGIAIPVELLPPMPPLLHQARVTEHFASAKSGKRQDSDTQVNRLAKLFTPRRDADGVELPSDPSEVGIPALHLKARAPGYYDVRTDGQHQVISARTEEDLAGALCREAVRRKCKEMDVSFKHRIPPERTGDVRADYDAEQQSIAFGWLDSIYRPWPRLLLSGHRMFTPKAEIEFRIRTWHKGRIYPAYLVQLTAR